MSAPLSNLQKRRIGMAAHAAWLACPEREALLACNPELSATAVEAAWRHVEQGKACGIQSLRECSQDHYGRILAHFEALAGDTAAAARTLGRDADNERRLARYKLDQALRERGLETGYAAAICRQQYRCPLDQATAGQLWRLLYTVRNRKKPLPAAAKPVGEAPF